MIERFTVDIPSDCSTDPAERARLAFMAAEDQAETYRMPCTWNGENIVVSRES